MGAAPTTAPAMPTSATLPAPACLAAVWMRGDPVPPCSCPFWNAGGDSVVLDVALDVAHLSVAERRQVSGIRTCRCQRRKRQTRPTNWAWARYPSGWLAPGPNGGGLRGVREAQCGIRARCRTTNLARELSGLRSPRLWPERRISRARAVISSGRLQNITRLPKTTK